LIVAILSNSFKNYKTVEYPLCQVDGRYFIPTPNKNGNIHFSFVYKTTDQIVTGSTNQIFISDTNPKIVFTSPESSKLGMWGLNFFMGTEFSQSKVYTTPNLFIKDIQGIQPENKKNEELWKWDQLEGTP
jgi:hypothetical protein